MFNFTLAKPTHVRIGDQEGQGLFVDIPQYKDLLASEYIQIEAIDKAEAEWNNKLVLLAQELSAAKGMNIWDVVEKLDMLDNMDNSAKAEFLGGKMTAMGELAATKPSLRQKQIKVVTVILRSRVSYELTELEVSKLPHKFLQQISDFIYQEQIDGEHIPYSSLKNQYEIATGKLSVAERVISAVNLQRNSPDFKPDEQLVQAVEEYYAYEQTLGKL